MKNNKKSLLLMIVAMTIFGTTGILRKNLDVPSVELAFWRGICGTVFLALFTKLAGRHIFKGLNTGKILGFAISGAFIGINWILLFESYRFTSVAIATLCYYMAPTIVILLSPLLFKEKITLIKGICAAVAVGGMALVSGIASSEEISAGDIKGIFFGLAAAAFYATVVIMNKKLPKVDTYAKTSIQMMGATVVMLPYVLIKGDLGTISFTGSGVVFLIIIGLVNTGLAYTLYFGGMDGLRAQTIAILSYIDPVVALLLSTLLLREAMSLAELIGAVMIIGSAVVSERQ